MWCCADRNPIGPEQAFVTINPPPPATTIPADSLLARIISRAFHRCGQHGPISETRTQRPPMEREEQAEEAIDALPVPPLERSLSQMEVSSFESLRSDESFWYEGEERPPVEEENKEHEGSKEASADSALHPVDVGKEEMPAQKEGESATYSTASTQIVRD